MNKITRATKLPIPFDMLLDDFDQTSYKQHRRGSNFYTRSIVRIDKDYFPELGDDRSYDGYWETNDYIFDSEYGYDKSEITELNRVEKKEKIIKTIVWEQVK